MAGVTMWIGRCSASCTMYSPRSVSTGRMPAASSTWFSSISSVTIDFDLTTLLTLCSPGDVQHEAVGLGGILGEKDLDAAGLHVALELHQQLVEIGDRVLLDLVGRLAPVLEIGDRRGHGRVVLAGKIADLGQVLEPRRRLVEAPVLVFQERGAVQVAGMFGHVEQVSEVRVSGVRR